MKAYIKKRQVDRLTIVMMSVVKGWPTYWYCAGLLNAGYNRIKGILSMRNNYQSWIQLHFLIETWFSKSDYVSITDLKTGEFLFIHTISLNQNQDEYDWFTHRIYISINMIGISHRANAWILIYVSKQSLSPHPRAL